MGGTNNENLVDFEDEGKSVGMHDGGHMVSPTASPASGNKENEFAGLALYSRMTMAFLKAQNNEEVLVGPACEAAKMIPIFYSRVFGDGYICNRLKDDIINHAEGAAQSIDWETFPDGMEPVESYTKRLVANFGVEALRGDWYCGINRLLWMKRTLDFVVTFLKNGFVEMVDSTMYEAASATYNDILKPYHGFVVSSVVTMAFNLCPSRESLLESLGFSEMSVAQEHLQMFLKASEPVVQRLHEAIEEVGCNFPEKV